VAPPYPLWSGKAFGSSKRTSNASGRQLRMIRFRNAFSRLFRAERKRKLRVLFSFEVEVEGRKKPIKIEVVEEQPCPYCGSKFLNRPKVHDEKG
jgi:DNA-directed RNA polymerase subunit RPC12/RpoP